MLDSLATQMRASELSNAMQETGVNQKLARERVAMQVKNLNGLAFRTPAIAVIYLQLFHPNFFSLKPRFQE